MTWQSTRFAKDVILTNHAQLRLEQRNISLQELETLIEQGEIRYKDEEHLWIYQEFPDRSDNMICAAAIERNALIIKTIMTNWELSE